MKYLLDTMREIATFVYFASKMLKEHQVEEFTNLLVKAYNTPGTKVLVMGAGRSGLVARAFAMRLMHLGYNAYVLGDTIVPSVREGDVVVAISGSGSTKLVLAAAEAAKQVGATVVVLTSYPHSPLGKMADVVVEIPGRTKVSKSQDYFARQILGQHEPLAPLGTLFEITVQSFLDSLVVELMHRLGKSEEDLRMQHANIEL
ncbi:MAG: 6-phospho-3-hexuloisomerase [Crenarchaeota archaeon]|nr:6-phospho-3-hexuloisomerase [Thermoproteota archaeon]